jgi:hypothetical protein
VLAGLSTTFQTGATHGLEEGAIVKEVTALHVTVAHAAPWAGNTGWPAVSVQIAALRKLLTGNETDESGKYFAKAAQVIFSSFLVKLPVGG